MCSLLQHAQSKTHLKVSLTKMHTSTPMGAQMDLVMDTKNGNKNLPGSHCTSGLRQRLN